MRPRAYSLASVFLAAALIPLGIFKLPFFPETPDRVIQEAQKPPPSTTSGEAAVSAGVADPAKLEKYLTVEAALLGVSNNMSLFFKDLDHNQEISIEPTRSWIPASTIKAYVVVEAFRQRRLGWINFDQTVVIKPENVVPTELETDDFPRLREGTQVTIRQLVEAMIIQSDNTAYNTLLDILDRRNINATLREMGITETVVGEKLNLDDNQLAKDLQVPGRQPDTTTAKDFATLFNFLYNKQTLDSDEIIDIFKRQVINNMIPALLPEKVPVAHKTGDWAPIFHDGGVVYKPAQPFILSIFTNSNDPAVLAKLARVAYLARADAVGTDINLPAEKKSSGSLSRRYLATNAFDSQVLGVQTGEKFPTVTAQDLGITTADLSMDAQDVRKIPQAIITPGSIFYNHKLNWEKLWHFLAFTDNQKIKAHLTDAEHRLGEIRTLGKKGDLKTVGKLLGQSEGELQQAVVAATANKEGNDTQLPQIKKISDLHYATLADVAKTLPAEKKEEFVDMVYQFYQKNKQEVKKVVQDSVVANPLQQQPLIGTIEKIEGNTVTLKADNGKERQAVMDAFTPVRGFHQQTQDQQPNTLQPGSKVAIIGQISDDKKVVPQFILRDIPKQLPDKLEGVVTEVNPGKRILNIRDRSGKNKIVQVDNETVLKGRDTGISLEGIKAGSSVTVFGEVLTLPLVPSPTPSGGPKVLLSPVVSPTSSITPTLTPSPSPTSATLKTKLLPGVSPTTKALEGKGTSLPVQAPAGGSAETTIHATTVTVTGNSSGKNEKIEKPVERKSKGETHQQEPPKPEKKEKSKK